MLLSLLCTLTMLSALLSPNWITAFPQTATFDHNITITFTPSLGVYARCGRPITSTHPACTLMSVEGLRGDSDVYPTVWKTATVFLAMGKYRDKVNKKMFYQIWLPGLVVMSLTVCAGLLSCCVQSVCKKSIFTLSGAAQCIAGKFNGF